MKDFEEAWGYTLLFLAFLKPCQCAAGVGDALEELFSINLIEPNVFPVL